MGTGSGRNTGIYRGRQSRSEQNPNFAEVPEVPKERLKRSLEFANRTKIGRYGRKTEFHKNGFGVRFHWLRLCRYLFVSIDVFLLTSPLSRPVESFPNLSQLGRIFPGMITKMVRIFVIFPESFPPIWERFEAAFMR